MAANDSQWQCGMTRPPRASAAPGVGRGDGLDRRLDAAEFTWPRHGHVISTLSVYIPSGALRAKQNRGAVSMTAAPAAKVAAPADATRGVQAAGAVVVREEDLRRNSQGWPRFWHSCKTLIEISSQTAGPAGKFWPSPVRVYAPRGRRRGFLWGLLLMLFIQRGREANCEGGLSR